MLNCKKNKEMDYQNMSREQLKLLLCLELQKLCILLTKQMLHERHKKRRFAVRKILRERRKKGYYGTLIPRMRLMDVETFKSFHRMDPQSFDELLALLGPNMQNIPLRSEEEITIGERLALTLRYLGSGDSMKSIGFDGFRIGTSTTSNIIRQTCCIIWEKLQFVFPTQSEVMWNKIANEFYDKWGFPNCLGTLNAKHVVVQPFAKHNANTYNHNNSHGFLLIGITDANFKFVMLDICNNDDADFSTSTIGNKILYHPEELNIPSDEALPITNEIAPFVFVADEGFPLSKNLLRPYTSRNGLNLPYQENIFNSQISRSREIIAQTNNMLAKRFEIYRKPIIASQKTAINIVKATVCLHNWLLEKSADDNFSNEDQIENQNLLEMEQVEEDHAAADAVNVRKIYTNYFIKSTLNGTK